MANYGLLTALRITQQRFGVIPTICSSCRGHQTFSCTDPQKGDFTVLCRCGCTVFKHHYPDDFSDVDYYSTIFIPKKKYDRRWKEKDNFERAGFEKKLKNNGTVYSK